MARTLHGQLWLPPMSGTLQKSKGLGQQWGQRSRGTEMVDCSESASPKVSHKRVFILLVHRVAAFAMASPRCQWRHRCVVTLGEILAVLYRNHCGERKNESKGRKAMRAMSKSLHGNAAKQGEPSQRWHYKIGEITCVARNLRCASLRFALQWCGALSSH